MKNILVFIEQRDGKIQNVSYELLAKARELANTLGEEVIAVLPCDKADKPKDLIKYGADKVYIAEDKLLKNYLTETYAKVMYEAITETQPQIVLIGATSIGRDLAPRLAARLKTGLTADCVILEIQDETKHLLMTRPAFGGNILATISCQNHRPQMATVREGVFSIATFPDIKGEVIDLKVNLDKSTSVKIVDIQRELSTNIIDITKSQVLIGVGRGVGEQNLPLVRELATLLNADLAATRPVIEEGWIEKEYQVGQTGKIVKPDVYIAVGISGAIQHTIGYEKAKYVIAINKNPEAPVFATAKLGIVGDLKIILPKLIKQIKETKKLEA